MRTLSMIVVIKSIIKTCAIITLSAYALSYSLIAFAEAPTSSATIPSKGMTQTQVRNTFGEPSSVKPPVGKPAITRWDYSDYSVYFEGQYLIHSFRHSQRTQATATSPKPTMAPITQPEPEQPEPEQLEPEQPEPVKNAQAADNQEIKAQDTKIQDTETPKTIIDEPEVEEITTQVKEEKAEMIDQAELSSEEIEKAVAQAKEEKDLNFEESKTKADFGKWGY